MFKIVEYTTDNADIIAICESYNSMVDAMIENGKRITDDQIRSYQSAFHSKKCIEKTVKCLGYHFEFDYSGNAVNLIENSDSNE